MKSYLLLTLLLLTALTSSAQYISDSLSAPGQALSPQKEQGKKVWLHTGLAAGYAGTAYIFYKYEDSHFREESQEHRTPFLDGIAAGASFMGESKNAWMALGATTGLAYLSRNTRLQKTVFVWAGTLLLNGVVTDKLKHSFQRYRPNTGMSAHTFDGLEGPGVHHSLPSAHTSNAFATATVFATLYKDKKWVPPLAYGLAAVVGASRVHNNAHWVSDVMAGAAVGYLSARAMLATDKWLSRKGVVLYPQVGRRCAGIGLVKSL